MGERTKFKAGEKSPRTLFCNAKEEILLKRQLRILESMKKQVEIAVTLDQRIVYNRFTLKLRRSELAHARLLGNKHLIQQLSLSLFPDLHSKVMDGSKEAVRRILENPKATRAISAPGKIQQPPALPVFVVQKHHKKAEIKDAQKQLEVTEETDVQIKNTRKNGLGDESISISKGQIHFNKPVTFLEYKRPHTTNYWEHGSLPDVNYRSQERFVKIPPEQQDLALKAKEPSTASSSKGFADQGLKEGSLEQKHKNSRTRNYKSRPSTRNLFLGLDNTPMGIRPGTGHPLTANQNESLNSKVEIFIQKLTARQQEQDCVLTEDYFEQVLGNLGRIRQVNNDFLGKTEEKCQWSPVGQEAGHQSLTIKNPITPRHLPKKT